MTKYLLALLSALLVANTFSAEYNVYNPNVDGSRRDFPKVEREVVSLTMIWVMIWVSIDFLG